MKKESTLSGVLETRERNVDIAFVAIKYLTQKKKKTKKKHSSWDDEIKKLKHPRFNAENHKLTYLILNFLA